MVASPDMGSALKEKAEMGAFLVPYYWCAVSGVEPFPVNWSWVEEQQTWGSATWGPIGGSASDQEGFPQQARELVLDLDLEK